VVTLPKDIFHCPADEPGAARLKHQQSSNMLPFFAFSVFNRFPPGDFIYADKMNDTGSVT